MIKDSEDVQQRTLTGRFMINSLFKQVPNQQGFLHFSMCYKRWLNISQLSIYWNSLYAQPSEPWWMYNMNKYRAYKKKFQKEK